jgi:tetratricopeptide (TPR) repeat protein
MILRITAVLFLVRYLCAAQATQDSLDLDHRLRLVETERSHGRLAAAESMLADVQADIERTQGSSLQLTVALREHGLLRDDAGRPEDAIPFYERALALARAQPGFHPSVVGLLLAHLASSHAACGESDVALALSTESMSIMRANVDRMDTDFAVSLYAHGLALRGLGRDTEALRDQREALDIWRSSAKPDYAQVALLHDEIASCLSDLGYGNQAEASERESLAIREKILEPNSLGIAAALNNLGVILVRAHRLSEGRQPLERAALILGQCGNSEQKRLADALGNLGAVYYAEARNNPRLYAKADEVYRRKLAIEEGMLEPSNVRMAATLEMLGEVLYCERAYDEAGRVYGRGLAIQQAAFGPADPKTKAAAKRYSAMAKKMTADLVK